MTNRNIESRIANRTNSVFSALGTIINDFYLEAGIYFVGGFNAALVAWDIYTGLLKSQQPPLYAIALGIVSFVAVEGLAVYLVGAAAKTNSRLLWFFSVVFATFFTYAHYREMTNSGVISEYITLAIPFFVVVGYWARTVKNDLEASQAKEDAEAQKHEDERKLLEAEKFNLAEDDRAEQKRINAEQREFDREMERQKAERSHALKMTKLASQERPPKVSKSNSNTNDLTDFNSPFDGNLNTVNERRKLSKLVRLTRLETLLAQDPEVTNTALGKTLGVSRQTIISDKKELSSISHNGTNVDGYELPPTNGHPV